MGTPRLPEFLDLMLGSIMLLLIRESCMSVFRSLSQGIGASRLLSCMAIFAFASFAAVDTFMIDEGIGTLFQVRVVFVLGATLLLGMTWTRLARQHATSIGMLLCVWTGVGVVILTELTGGASSPYWTMVMLTFFTVTLVLPMKAWQATLSFGSVAMFYSVWMVLHEATGSPANWASSNAGIWLSVLVSVLAATFLDRMRMRDDSHRHHLETLNEQLRAEIAERERIQKVALRTQQLDAVGQLASGLAHELNNILMVISGAAETMRRMPDSFEKNTDRIIYSAQRGGRLTSDLLLFAREGTRADEPFCVDDLVRGVAELIESSHRGRVKVVLDLSPSPCWVMGDAQLLSQVVLNLCLNSIHAMDGEGTLDLRCGSSDASDDESLRIEVEDQGKGMSAEEMRRAFEPFFTTKGPGEGTGLGLSMAYGTVQDHGGTLELESVLGQGTRATITLPRISAPELMVGAVEAKKPAKIEPGCVLLVDDDPMVRAVMQDALQGLGLTVISARDGADALTQCQNSEPPIRLVILDMIMPVMDGAETFTRLRRLQPNVPILVYSGFALEQSTSASFTAGNWRFMRKPFTNEELREAVSGLLEGAS